MRGPAPGSPLPHGTQHTCALQLLCQCLLGAVELEEERGCHGAVQVAVPVAGVYHDVIQELNAGHGHCSLEDLNGGIHGRLDTGECTGGGHCAFR